MRKLILGLAGAAAMTAASAASATTYMGATAGCFVPSGTCAQATTATINGLTFNTGSFNQEDSNGFLAIGSIAENFGTFTLTGAPGAYSGLFSLLVNFTVPAGTSGANTFSAVLTGSVSSANAGGVFLDFDNTAHLYTYPGGSFNLRINDVSVNAGGAAAQITGVITAVPEPATWGLMLLGFAGVGMAMRRRRQPVLAQLA